MKRIRHLGLAAVMALAFTVLVGVGSASAAGFAADEYPATIMTKETASTTILFEAKQATCSLNFGDATLKGPGGSISPVKTYDSSCTMGPLGSATLEMKGCTFTFRPAAPGTGKLDLGPAGCGPVVLNGASCDWLFSPASDLSATYGNVEKEGHSTVQVTPDADLQYTPSPKNLTCGTTGGTATLSGIWSLVAVNKGGAYTDLFVKSFGPFFNKGLFEAEAYPLAVSGGQDAAGLHALHLGNRTIECSNIEFNGNLTGATTALAVDATYAGCKTKPVLGISQSVNMRMNGCSYVFNGAGTLDLVCAEAGEAIEVELSNGSKTVCTHRIAPQKGVGSVGYSSVGDAIKPGVQIALALEGIKSTADKSALICGPSESTNGTYSGSTTLYELTS
ncbi:MAG TPA: hypothetical protein VNO20_09935 [Solirubrobacterales bacterium]|nr:hypothetical protein [Solirubrobacterales bacterium]